MAIVGRSGPERDAAAALDLLRHRGPDDGGVWSDDLAWLGHRRLSIIDRGEGGHQPMVDPATGAVITYNGEIYNYLELRRELEGRGHSFSSRSDTEVLLRSYLEWGSDCLARLNGMWAFVIWDPRTRQAFFARDRFGVKPFYYALLGGGMAIASEPKAIVAAYPRLGRVDESAVRALLAEKLVHHDERCFYADIKVLPAGHWGTYRPGAAGPRVTRYWRYPDPSSVSVWDEPEAVERFSTLLADAVELRLRSDVPVGMTLSGGTDSTAILDAMARIRGRAGEGVRSYTAVYREMPEERAIDERRWARVAASAHPNVTLTEVHAGSDSWLQVLRRIVWHMDGPGVSPAVFPMWMIMEQARADGIPVLLEGQGADEVFGGYVHYAALAALDRLGEGPPSPSRVRAAIDAARAGRRAGSTRRLAGELAIATVPAIDSWQRRRTTLGELLRPDVAGGRPGAGADPNATNPADDAGSAVGGGRCERRLRADFSRRMLPGFLQYGDAVSMAHSIEARLPFLDYRLVELGVSLPPPARIGAGETKRLVRAYLRQAGQCEIADRPDKRGYPTPASSWLAANDGTILRELLLDRAARVRSVVDPDLLGRAIDRHVAGKEAAGDALYALLATELWWQQATKPVTEAHRRALELAGGADRAI